MNTETKFGTEAALRITNNRGDERCYIVKTAHGVYVGTSSNCGIQLDDPAIANIHCRLELDQGSLRLQKWLSAGEIKVNHQEIDFEISLAVNDLIHLGNYEIRIVKHGSTREIESKSHLGKKLPHRTDWKHFKHLPPIESQFAASNSIEKLQNYLNEICREDDLHSANATSILPGSQALIPENSNNANADPTLDTPAEANLVDQLRQEIAKLQNQLSETAERNNRLQHRLIQISERKGERRGNQGSMSQRNPTRLLPDSDNSTSSLKTASLPQSTDLSNRTASHGNLAHTTARTKSLTTKRLSNLATDGRYHSGQSAPNSDQTEDRIQSLRTQLREQYESNKNPNSILSRLTQLWK